MAVLSAADRARVYAAFVAELGASPGETIGITKADLAAAVAAIDAWADSNAASLNAAIPQPARAALTTKQKVRLFRWVVARRYEVS